MQLYRDNFAIKFFPSLDGNILLQLVSLQCICLSLSFQNGVESPSIVSIVPSDLSNSLGSIHLTQNTDSEVVRLLRQNSLSLGRSPVRVPLVG